MPDTLHNLFNVHYGSGSQPNVPGPLRSQRTANGYARWQEINAIYIIMCNNNNKLILIIQFFYSANSRMAVRCAAQEI